MKNYRVKDLEFKSADHVIEEIRNMNVKGGSPFGRSAAWAFKLACEQEKLESVDALKERFEVLTRQMIELKPTMATIHNSCDLVKEMVDQTSSEALAVLKQKVIALCERIIESSFEAVDTLAVYGANLIHEGDTILMHSYSSTLMGIFKAAAYSGKHFKVICTESRPLRESRNAVKILQEIGAEVVFISDASVYEFMPQADLIIMGVDTLTCDGSVANKMGSAQIARLAKSCKKPVYFASELYKLDMRTLEGYRVELERRTPWELVCKEDFETFEHLEVINQFFDLTPASDITGIITEYGLLAPAQLLGKWEQLRIKLLGKQNCM